MANTAPKTRATRASAAAFIAAQRDPQVRADCRVLAKLMRAATGAPARMWGTSIVGYGRYHYRGASGREGDWYLAGFAPRKGLLSIYIVAGFADAAALLRKLGKHKHSMGCLYVKRLADIDLKVLDQLVRRSVRALQKRKPG